LFGPHSWQIDEGINERMSNKETVFGSKQKNMAIIFAEKRLRMLEEKVETRVFHRRLDKGLGGGQYVN
jgi:hypothetical protein